MQDEYSLHNIVLISKLFIIEAELLNKIGRHLLHLIIRKGLAKPKTNDNDIVLALHKAGHYFQYRYIANIYTNKECRMCMLHRLIAKKAQTCIYSQMPKHFIITWGKGYILFNSPLIYTFLNHISS